MSEVKEVKMYACPVTGKLFKSKTAAAKNGVKELAAQKAAKALAEQQQKTKEQKEKERNSVRLNLTDIKDLPKMIIESADKYLNLDVSNLSINVSFGDVSNSHGCPINGVTNWSGRDKNAPQSYKGWSGQVVATVKSRVPVDNRGFSSSASDSLFGRYGSGFAGFHTGTGCPGSISDKDGYHKMDIGFYFFLDDFPLLKAQYERFLVEKEKFIKNKEIRYSYVDAVENYSDSQADVLEIDGKVAVLQKQIADLLDVKGKLLSKHGEEYKKKNPIALEPMAADWEQLKDSFTSRWGERWLNDYE